MRAVIAARGITALVCALGVQASVGAQQSAAPALQAPAPPSTSADQPLDILAFDQDMGQRMTVPVNVVGQGPYQFLVDTGAERTVISKELAQRLSLQPGKSVTIHTMTEVSQVATAHIPTLEVSKSTISGVNAPALAAQNLGAVGMLGVDSLQSQRVVFDFRKKTMTISPSKKVVKHWGPDEIVITGRSLYGRLVLVDAEIEGQKIIVVMDTGSQVSIGNEALRRKLQAKRRLPATVPVELMSVTGGRMTADYTAVRRIRIGGIDIKNMPIAFADVHPFKQLQLMDRPAFLLGMDVLQLFQKVSVDFARKEVRFLPEDSSSLLTVTRMAAWKNPAPYRARKS